jgi:hypothetical protein
MATYSTSVLASLNSLTSLQDRLEAEFHLRMALNAPLVGVKVKNSMYGDRSTATATANTLEQEQSLIPLLDLVDAGAETSCPEGLILVPDTRSDNVLPGLQTTASHSKIPKVVHVTAKSRCMTQDFAENLDKWRFPDGYSLLIHNDAAVDKLMHHFSPDFPELKKISKCLRSGAGIADLWRALLLWEYGGIYTDMDNAPNQLFQQGKAIANEDEAFFVVDTSGVLSQYFMAAAPRHPVMYLLVSKIIQRLFSLNSVDRQYVPRTTGPGALKFAFIAFMNDQGKNIFEGAGDCNTNRNFRYNLPKNRTYTGWDGWKVTVAGHKHGADDYVIRSSVKTKKQAYEAMNMSHFDQQSALSNYTKEERNRKNLESCIRRIYMEAGHHESSEEAHPLPRESISSEQ